MKLIIRIKRKIPFSYNRKMMGIGIGGVQKLRLYDVAVYALKAEFECQGPVLDCCFHDDSSGYSACADHSLSR